LQVGRICPAGHERVNVCFLIKCLTLVLKLEAHTVSNEMSVYNTGAYSLFSEIVNN